MIFDKTNIIKGKEFRTLVNNQLNLYSHKISKNVIKFLQSYYENIILKIIYYARLNCITNDRKIIKTNHLTFVLSLLHPEKVKYHSLEIDNDTDIFYNDLEEEYDKLEINQYIESSIENNNNNHIIDVQII